MSPPCTELLHGYIVLVHKKGGSKCRFNFRHERPTSALLCVVCCSYFILQLYSILHLSRPLLDIYLEYSVSHYSGVHFIPFHSIPLLLPPMGKRINLRGDGDDGTDGVNGSDGVDAEHHGRHGTDGANATEPKPGQNGKDILMTLSTAAVDSSPQLVQICAQLPLSDCVLHDESYSLDSVPNIRWSATGGDGGSGANGGRGGNGSPGANGTDAMFPDIPGTNGQPGGNGGKGGIGSSGANAGDGGNFKVQVHEKDTYLLMLLEPSTFRESLLTGGKGGQSGEHGSGGLGGPGGKGGQPLVIHGEDANKKSCIPGGKDGSPGADGLKPVWELKGGLDGNPGSFTINLIDGKEECSFAGRYNIVFENLEFEGTSPMADPSECEFGDVISIRNIKVKNTGLMPLPKYQEVHFSVKDAGNPNVIPLISRTDAFLPAGTSCGPGESAVSEGTLKLFSGFPGDVDDEYDFHPLRKSLNFHIHAYQYGPISVKGKERKSDFMKEYVRFHAGDGSTVSLSFTPGVTKPLRSREEGVPLTLRYPIENLDGLKAARSLFPGEATTVSFNIQNVGATAMGGFDLNSGKERHRRVAVRYFYLRSKMFDLPSEMIHCSRHSRNGEGDAIDLVDSPTLLDVPNISPGEAYDFKTTLAFGDEGALYSRMALVVDLFIESLPVPKGIQVGEESINTDPRMPSMSVVQRRKLEFICEPVYEKRNDATFVLVTSYATTRVQFDTWTQDVLTDTLNVEYEVFSVSRYGTLDPTFVIEGETTLRDAFSNKVVIVLPEPFKENVRDTEAISPLQLLPNGCMQQTSGYDPSTRFLLVGVDETHTKPLLQKHLASEPVETGTHPDVGTFQRFIQKLANDRAARGHEKIDLPIRLDTIYVSLVTSKDSKAAQKLLTIADSLAEFLKQTDPLNQYTIECFDSNFATEKKGIIVRKQSYLEVRRGFSRTLNSAICVTGKYCAEPKQITSDGIIMAIAEAMTRESRVTFLADAIRNGLPAEVMTAFKYACVSELIRECTVFLKSEMKIGEDLDLSFPSIGALLESVEMLALIRDCKTSKELLSAACDVLSDLLARLELVANSKDLRPRFSLDMFSHKKTTLDAMSEIVSRLRVQWKNVISSARIEEVKMDLKLQIKDFLKEDAGRKTVNYRAGKRWIQGLNYVHSTENDDVFGIANPCKRLIELDIDEKMNNYKIPPPSVRVFSSGDLELFRCELAANRDRCIQIANIIQLNRRFAVPHSNDVLSLATTGSMSSQNDQESNHRIEL